LNSLKNQWSPATTLKTGRYRKAKRVGKQKNLKMKKITILLSIILFIGLTTNLFAQKDRNLSNGGSINLVIGFPSSTYGVTSDSNIDSKYQLSSIWGIQWGNRWYFKPKEKYGFGLMVNWLDLSIGATTGTETSYDWARAVVDFSFLEIGPVGTYALTKDIALDAYYNLRPTGFSSAIVTSNSGGKSIDESMTYVGVGFTHALGAAFRYRALNLGLEYVMGSLDSEGKYTGSSNDVTMDNQKNVVNNFRIMIGAKF
jgi:hypothetical protein